MAKRSDKGTGGTAPLAFLPLVNGTDREAIVMALRPLELWQQWRAEFYECAAPATSAWIERRREGARATLEALERMSTTTDPEEAHTIQTEWMQGEMARLEADLKSLFDPGPFWPEARGEPVKKPEPALP